MTLKAYFTSFNIIVFKSTLLKVKGCYSTFNIHVLDYCQGLRMRGKSINPKIHHKQIELWILHMGIRPKCHFQLPATSGNSKSKQNTFPLIKTEFFMMAIQSSVSNIR